MLEEYGKKRDFARTPEPPPRERGADSSPLTFVIQKHAARRLHYDFRLEWDGVLKSWAVPKAPSLNPADKRLAVQTEDHPLDYASFEGIIPKGEYGGGQVIVWDNGTYSPDEHGELLFHNRAEAEARMRRGLAAGKISLFLRGSKLQGSWALVKIASSQRDWLLIKHQDEFVDPARDVTLEDRSIFSGLTIEDLKNGRLPDPKHAVRHSISAPEDLPGARRGSLGSSLSPMLPTLTERPFSNPEWLFEPKLDGVRAITLIRDGKIKLLSRSGLDPTHQYPSLVEELKRQAGRELALDGEIVAFDEQGRPSFQRVQQRLGLTRPEDIRRAEAETPVVYYVFDLLHLDGYDLRGSPLDQRKELLKNVLVPSEHVRLVEHFTTEGEAAYEAAVEHGLEGLVAKCRKSAYESGRRSRQWLKIKKTRSDDFVVGGFSQGLGGRSDTFGALLVGYYDQTGKLIFAGQVGTGFDDKLLADLKKRLESLRTPECPFTPRPPLKGPTTWVRPELVAEVKYVQWTQDGRLRAPVFLRLREDKPPAEATGLEIVATPEEVEAPAETDRPVAQDDIASILEQLQSASNKVVLEAQGRKVPISNLDRIFWPPFGDQRALTKRDLLAYLAQSAPHYLSHLRDRPLSLIRFPGGIQGERFFQKHWEHNLPRFVETVSLYSDHNVGDGEYMLCNNLPTLLWLGQIAALELHTWYSRVDPEPDGHHLPANFAGSPENIRSSLLNYPDFLIFDLDPYIYSGQEGKGEEPELNRAAFAKTCDIALSLKDILDGLSLSSFVKLSGRTGLHIFVSILRQLPYEATRSVAETVGRFLLNQRPKEVTMEWAVQKRSGKIFFDHNQNVRGKTVASIYSPRSAPEATVSMPLRWDEVGKIYPTDFTILTAPERLRQVGDVWQGILDAKHDLQALLDIPDEAKTPPEPPKRRRKASAQAGPSP